MNADVLSSFEDRRSRPFNTHLHIPTIALSRPLYIRIPDYMLDSFKGQCMSYLLVEEKEAVVSWQSGRFVTKLLALRRLAAD